MRRPLAPKTAATYDRLLARAFGDVMPPYRTAPDVAGWANGTRVLLQNAVRRQYSELRLDPTDIVDAIPVDYAIRREVEIPSEEEARAYEKAAAKLEPGRHALALLPLALGLRANEVLSLTRAAVERGARTGELLVLRKGGKEQRLPAKHARELLAELLNVPAQPSRALTSPLETKGKKWQHAGEILSGGAPIAQYHQLRFLVKAVGKTAGLKGLHPHLLRHACATRMARAGAPIHVIQWFLGHANVATTSIYVHTEAADAAKYLG